MMLEVLRPAGWARLSGHANGITAGGRLVFVARQISRDDQRRIVSDRFADQFCQALASIVAVLAAAGAHPEQLVRLTW